MTTPDPVSLGCRYRDTVTGIEGHAIERLESLTATTQYRIQGMARNGQPVDVWFDWPRLTALPPIQPVSCAPLAGVGS